MGKRVFIKYGEKDHLKAIMDGTIRFAPSQLYVKMEEELHNKGQGDLLEGKLVFYAEGLKMTCRETGVVYNIPGKRRLCVQGQNINNMPVFCISEYGEEYISKDNVLNIPKDKIESIKSDFPNATHALVIVDSDEFVNAVRCADGHNIHSDSIHYFDYDYNSLNMMMFLSCGDENAAVPAGKLSLAVTYEDRYRILLCKDTEFKNQDEYRFITLDELSSEPEFYHFSYNGKYILVPIEELINPMNL